MGFKGVKFYRRVLVMKLSKSFCTLLKRSLLKQKRTGSKVFPFRIDTFSKGLMILMQGRQYCKNHFALIWNGVYSKRKEFAPNESKFCPFRIDHFSKKGVICRKANRKSQKLSVLWKLTEKLSNIFSPLKCSKAIFLLQLICLFSLWDNLV